MGRRRVPGRSGRVFQLRYGPRRFFFKMKPPKLDQSEVLDRIQLLTAAAKQHGIELPSGTTDIIEKLEAYEAAVPTQYHPMKTNSSQTVPAASKPPEDIQSLGQDYDKLPIESRTKLMAENGASIREAILAAERSDRMNPKN